MNIKECPHCNGTGIEPFMPNNSSEIMLCSVCHGGRLICEVSEGELVIPLSPVLNDEDIKLIRKVIREELDKFKQELLNELKKESGKK